MIDTNITNSQVCAICGRQARNQPHHKTPRSCGGSDSPTNLIYLCPNHHDLVHAAAWDWKTLGHADNQISKEYMMGSKEYNLLVELSKLVFYAFENKQKTSKDFQKVILDIPWTKYVEIKDHAKRSKVSINRYLLEVIKRFA